MKTESTSVYEPLNYLRAFGVMLQFLTRIPLPMTIPCDDETFRRGIYSFVPVGLVLGFILQTANHLLNQASIDLWAQALLILWVHVWLTGGLHLDGVADSADGLLSNRPPERMLEIMKDSRIGANGVVSLMALLSLKAVGIRLALDLPNTQAVLFLMPVIARYAVVFGAYIGKTPHASGMGNLFIGKVTRGMWFFNALLVAFAAWFFPMILVSMLGATAFTWLLVRQVTKLIGGITGDILGTIIETNEVFFLALTFAMYLLFL